MGSGTRTAALVLTLAAFTAAVPGTPADSAPRTESVLVIGDSLEVGTGPYLRSELGSTPLTIDARKGRPSSEGVGVLSDRLSPEHTIVVFDLGVNDDPAGSAPLARNLAAVRRIVGERCLVVATLSRPPLGGVSIEGNNSVIESFVAEAPGARLFDWRAATESDPALLGPDRLHPGTAGYAARARLLARSIQECLEPGTAARPRRAQSRKPLPQPAARPKPRRRPRISPIFKDLLDLAPVSGVISLAEDTLARTEAAARDLAQALSPPPREPSLGEAGRPPTRELGRGGVRSPKPAADTAGP